ncbi:MAG TPA: hypothetical protein VLK58_09075 [Conexibacter sp.]|nr:hypothetical protein [Conexibacter sp.]
MRRVVLAALVACLLAVLAGCGADSDDLFRVSRSGSLPDARVDITVNDGGTISCDRGEARQLDSKLLLRGRDIVRELSEDAPYERVLPRPANAQLRFDLHTLDGTIEFSETDGAREPQLGRMVQLVRELAQRACGLER